MTAALWQDGEDSGKVCCEVETLDSSQSNASMLVASSLWYLAEWLAGEMISPQEELLLSEAGPS